jgi:hypothetical protein
MLKQMGILMVNAGQFLTLLLETSWLLIVNKSFVQKETCNIMTIKNPKLLCNYILSILYRQWYHNGTKHLPTTSVTIDANANSTTKRPVTHVPIIETPVTNKRFDLTLECLQCTLFQYLKS